MSFLFPGKKKKKERTPEQKVRRGAWAAGALLAGFLIIFALPNAGRGGARTEDPSAAAERLMDRSLDSLVAGSVLAGGTVVEKSGVSEISLLDDTPLRDTLTYIRAELQAAEFLGPRADGALVKSLRGRQTDLEARLQAWESDPANRTEYYTRRVVVLDPAAFARRGEGPRLFVCRQRMEKGDSLRQGLVHIVELKDINQPKP